MPNPIVPRKSSVASKVPLTANLQIGEIASNLADRILYSKDGNNSVYIVKADPLYNTGLQANLDLKANVANPIFTGTVTSPSFTSTATDGTAPLIVSSNTVVTNLNADLLDGQHGTYYTANSDFTSHTANTSNPHSVTATQVGLGNVTNESKTTMFSSPSFTGETSTGNVHITGDLSITSNTVVTNLNADLLDGQHGTYYTANSQFASHTANTSNPHSVTATQVGLGNVTNESKTTMFSNPEFTGTGTANNFNITGTLGITSNTVVTNLNADLLDGQHGNYYTANSQFGLHTANTSNPHSVTATQVGLGNVTNESKTTMFSNPTFTGNVAITGNLSITSNTFVSNLNADLLDGYHFSDLEARFVNVTGDTITGNLAVVGNITTNTLQFNTSANGSNIQQGEVYWSANNRTFDCGLGNGVVGQSFQELYYPLVKNNTVNTIYNGTAVASSGSDNGNLTIVPYIANGSMTPDSYLGVTTEDILSGGFGLVTYFGRVNDLNTSAWHVGTVLYASDTVAGTYSNTAPIAPSDLTIIGTVAHQGATNGAVDIRLDIKPRADQIPYDHTASGMTADNVKGALDELQFNKADVGTLASNINLYPTTYSANVDSYTVLVTSTADPRYNANTYNFAIGPISGSAQLLATRIADANIFVGNPGVITLTYLAYLRRTVGNSNQYSEFFWRLYKRSANTAETFLGESSSSGDVTSSSFSLYPMYVTLNDGVFVDTDRLVIRTYANQLGSVGGGSYESQLGGQNPSKILLPVPANVIPTPPASDVETNTTNFNHILSSTDTSVQAALDKLDDYAAPLYSPALSGTPTAPTPAYNANNTQIATTQFVQTNISNFVNGAPSNLDTLGELASAINNDASYHITVDTALATKAANTAFVAHTANTSNPHQVTATQVGLGNVTNESKTTMFSSPTFTGTGTANNFNITGTLGITSNAVVTNLNADLLDGQHGSYYTANSDFINLSSNVSTLSSNFSSHSANTSNPHSVTATQLNLGNVTNESKTTMFSSPTFTGTATANNFNITGTLGITSNAVITNLNADLLDGQHGSYFTANSNFAVLSSNVSTLSSNFSSHSANTSNPHSVTATQVGLGNVTNESKTTMFSSPSFTGTGTANNFNITGTLGITSNAVITNLNADLLDGQHGTYYTANSDFINLSSNVSTLSSNFSNHTANTSNPHSVTASQVGLGNVTNESKTTMFSSPSFTGTGIANNFNITGTFGITSNDLVTNLNADLLDGQHGSYYTTAGNLSGTIPSTVLGNSTVYIGTTSIALNRSSSSQTLTGISIDGNANTATYFGGQLSSFYAPLASPAFTGTATANNITTTGNIIVGGDLTVNGTTSTIHSTTLQVDDKNIEIGKVATPSDATADGGGITLKGTSDKTITWDQVNTNWTSSENWNIASGKTFKINNASVLSSTTLGSSVVNSSLTSVGTITSGTWSGAFGAVSGANLTSLTAGNLSGTIPSAVLGNSSLNIGTTSIALNRASGSQTLTGISIDGSAGSVAAANITGTTLASNVVSSSLTSVGTLGNLTVTNPISGSITGTASNITGTYTGTLTSSQITTGLGFTPYNSANPAGYITSSGSITGSAGSVAASNLTGTTLASNVVNSSLTGVGTLTSGTINLTTNITTTGVGYFGPASPLSLSNPLLVATSNNNGYSQMQVQNISSGASASSDWIATADNGTDTSKYVDLGINNSGYSSGTWTISGPNDAYLYVNSGNLTLGTDTTGKTVSIHTGGTLAANIVTTFNAAGTASANTSTGAVVISGGLGVSGTVTANTGNFVSGLTTVTAASGTSTTQVATTAFVQTRAQTAEDFSISMSIALG